MGEEKKGAILLDQIFKGTFTRHAGKPLAEVFAELKLKTEDGCDEELELRKAKLSLLSACTAELFSAIEKIKQIRKTVLIGCDVSEDEIKKGE